MTNKKYLSRTPHGTEEGGTLRWEGSNTLDLKSIQWSDDQWVGVWGLINELDHTHTHKHTHTHCPWPLAMRMAYKMNWQGTHQHTNTLSYTHIPLSTSHPSVGLNTWVSDWNSHCKNLINKCLGFHISFIDFVLIAWRGKDSRCSVLSNNHSILIMGSLH